MHVEYTKSGENILLSIEIPKINLAMSIIEGRVNSFKMRNIFLFYWMKNIYYINY